MNINLHIERLVLDGIQLEGGQHPLLQTAVETELTRLVNDGGLSSGLMRGGAVPQIPAGAIRLSEDSNPNNLGQQIAQAIYGGINK